MSENIVSHEPNARQDASINPRTSGACMEACFACALACDACADACLGEPDVRALKSMIRLDLNCADICACTARLLARSIEIDARLLRSQVVACARACAACADECHAHADHHEHCRLCARACRICAERCGAVLRELPDTYGDTHERPSDAALKTDMTETPWRELFGRAQ